MSNRKLGDVVTLGTALSIAPAAVGCALGILVGQRLGKRASQAVAASMFTVGVVAALPLAIELLGRRLNGPGTTRGQVRQQELIRDGGMLLYEEVEEVEESGFDLKVVG